VLVAGENNKKYGIGMYSIVVVWGAWDEKPN